MADQIENPLELPIEMYVDHCLTCGVRFAYPKHYEKARRDDHETFVCPSGHKQYFSKHNTLDKARDFEKALKRISELDVGVILNKHSLELAIEVAKTVLEKYK
jgi:hypothetical protein